MWTSKLWTDYAKTGRGTVAIGAVSKKGRKSDIEKAKAPGLPFLCHVDGSTASADYYQTSRKFAQDVIASLIAEGVSMPDQWKHVPLRLREIVSMAVRRRYPLYQLCADDYKVTYLISSFYYDTVVRARKKAENAAKEARRVHLKNENTTAALDDAPFTIESDADDTVVVASHSKHTTKRKAANEVAHKKHKKSRPNRVASTPEGDRVYLFLAQVIMLIFSHRCSYCRVCKIVHGSYRLSPVRKYLHRTLSQLVRRARRCIWPRVACSD